MQAKHYKKHFIPLESSPELFTQLIHSLGVSESLKFHDVLSLDDPDLLAFIPRPVYALILVFPTPSDYESQLQETDSTVHDYHPTPGREDVIWYKQTINNACGLYGILHAISNGDARQHIQPSSHIAHILSSTATLSPAERAGAIESDKTLEVMYKRVATQGQSEVPENPEDEVDFHYVCFVKSHVNGHLYELDGDRKGPVSCGKMDDGEDVLGEKALGLVRSFIEGAGDGVGFSMLALAPTVE